MEKTLLHISAHEYGTGSFEITKPVTEEEVEKIRPLVKALSELGNERYNFSTVYDMEWDGTKRKYIYVPQSCKSLPNVSEDLIDYVIKTYFPNIAVDGISSIDLWKVEVLEENKFRD